MWWGVLKLLPVGRALAGRWLKVAAGAAIAVSLATAVVAYNRAQRAAGAEAARAEALAERVRAQERALEDLRAEVRRAAAAVAAYGRRVEEIRAEARRESAALRRLLEESGDECAGRPLPRSVREHLNRRLLGAAPR